MNRSTACAAVGVVVCSLIVAACDGSGSSPGRSTPRSGQSSSTRTASSSLPGGVEVNTAAAQDKCKIVSATAVKSVVGGTLAVEMSGLSGIGNPTCTFQFTRAAAGRDTRILFSTNHSGKPSTFHLTKVRTTGAQTVSGLGDDAFFVRTTSTLQFLKGRQVVIIQANVRRVDANGAVVTTSREVLIRLARAVLDQ